MTHIVILESGSHKLAGLQTLRLEEWGDTNRVFVTMDIELALKAVQAIDPGSDPVVITSDFFDLGLTPDDVALRVKAIRSDAKVYAHTSEREERPQVDGWIRARDYPLSRVLRFFLRSLYERGHNRERLVDEFPEIEFTTGPGS